MALKLDRVDTWLTTIKDQSGALSKKLAKLADAGVNLEFIISRRTAKKPGRGVVFVTPIKGAAQIRAAKKAAFRKSKRLHTLRVEGSDKPGMGAKITEAIASEGISLRGFSAAAIGRKFVCHIALDKKEDATKVRRILKKL
jgi:prephenate dehydratase